MLHLGIDGFAVLEELFCGEEEGPWEHAEQWLCDLLRHCSPCCLLESIKECISLFLPGNSVDGFIVQVLEVTVYPYMSCLTLLFSTLYCC